MSSSIATMSLATVPALVDAAGPEAETYSFARIGAALAMKVEDIYVRNRRLWLRLHEPPSPLSLA